MDNGHDAAAQQPGTPEVVSVWEFIQSHSYNGILGLLVVAISGVGCAFMIFAAAARSAVSRVTELSTTTILVVSSVDLALCVSTAFLIGVGALQTLVYRREQLAALRADSLPERAKHAADVLQQASTLVAELQAELTARTALLEDVKRQVAETTQRASDMEKLTSVDDDTTRILNKYFDEALKHRLENLEHGARGREWLIGTVIALVVGIGAILFSHYVLGF